MLRKLIFLLVLLFYFGTGNGQIQTNYFHGKTHYCKPADYKTVELFQLGMDALQFKKYHGASSKIFMDLIKKDSTFCDAYFMTGYILDLYKKDTLAFPFLYVADSLAQNKSIEFKLTSAMNCMKVGRVDLAKKKYEEVIENFPYSPEGYYGVALISPIFGEFEYGLKNINIALSKYSKKRKDALFLKAILLTNLKRYDEAESLFESVKSNYKDDENFKIHYSLTLLKSAEKSNDIKLKKKAEKIYNSIRDKSMIPEYFEGEFIFD